MALLSLGLAYLATGPSAFAAPVVLERKFGANERLTYQVRSAMTLEQRTRELFTWMPEDVEIQYDFTTHVRTSKGDGIVDLVYSRPTTTIIEGETYDTPAKRRVERSNLLFELRVSPINEILEFKEMPKKAAMTAPIPSSSNAAQMPFGEFISEIQRLALNVGNFDSALDFNPKLPLDEVNVGDTWKKTVSFQPQKRSDTGKQAVQRLDYTFTYRGPATYNNKPSLRVTADLNLDSDLSAFLKDMTGMDSSETGLHKFPLKLKTTIRFDLDPVTKRTIYAESVSEGGFGIFTTRDKENAVVEQRLKGRTVMRLAGVQTVPYK